MDPITAFGVATAAIGLIPVCWSALEFIETACKSRKGAEVQVQRILMQRGNFVAWSEWWGLDKPIDENTKFTRHLRNTANGSLIMHVLLWLSQLFTDSEILRNRYGVKIDNRKFESFSLLRLDANEILKGNLDQGKLKSLQSHMGVLKRVRFAVRGEKQFADLVSDLNEYNSNLRNMCSEIAASAIERVMMNRVLSQNGTEDLTHLADAAKVMSTENPVARKGFDLIARTAEFKKRIGKLSQEPAREIKNPRFSFGEDRWTFNSGKATFAIDEQGRCCYIEWKSYKYGKVSKESILDLAKILCIEDLPSSLRVLPCLGVFDDPTNQRYGFVYRPPRYIENLPPNPPPGTSKLRKPTTLLTVLEESTKRDGWALELGIRFDIARALVQSLLILHTANWVHKNVRSSSVLFLPAESRLGGQPSQSLIKDLTSPYLSGFEFSRVESDDSTYDSHGPYYIGIAQKVITLDHYHHPLKRKDVTISYRHAFDVYSLGCVLLELGFWQQLKSFDPGNNDSPEHFRSRLIRLAGTELRGQVGRIYADATRACLSVKGTESPEEMRNLLCWDVASNLDACMA